MPGSIVESTEEGESGGTLSVEQQRALNQNEPM
jgi:hypothetical protein